MSKVISSANQKKGRLKFKEVQAAALLKLADPEIKAHYKSLCKSGQRPHNVLIAEMLKENRSPMNDIFTGVHIVSGNALLIPGRYQVRQKGLLIGGWANLVPTLPSL